MNMHDVFQHGDSNQHMIEYLAEMWVDIDRDRGTTVTEHTTCTGASEHANEGGPGASGNILYVEKKRKEIMFYDV